MFARSRGRQRVVARRCKLGDKADRAKGKLKEAAGAAAGDPGLEHEGKRDQAKGDVKQAGEKLKDAAKNVTR